MNAKTFKVLSLSLLLTLLVTLCSGCSDAMTGYWNLGKEISNLDTVAVDGTITISIEDDTLSAALKEEGVAPDLFENIVINYTGQQTNKELLSMLNFEVIFKTDMITATLPCRIYIDEQHFYISTEDIIAIIKQFADEEYVNAYQEFFGDALWVDIFSFSEEEMQLYGALLNDNYAETILQEYDLFIDLFTGAYGGLESDILVRKGDTYTIKLDNENTAAFLEEIVTYTVENIGDVLAAFKTYIEKSAIIDAQTKQELLATWDADFGGIEDEMARFPEEDIADITNAVTAALTVNCPIDFDMQADLQRVRKGLYNETAEFNMAYDIDGIPGYEGKVVITEKATTKSAPNAKIALPTEGIASLDYLTAEARKNADAVGVEAVIYLDDDFMYFSKTYAVPFLDQTGYATAEHRIVDNSTYLPLRQISEALGEEVGWDNAKKQAYVVVNGENLYVKSFADTSIGRTYIKVRDFEQLGFTVDYTKDEYSGAMVTLTK